MGLEKWQKKKTVIIKEKKTTIENSPKSLLECSFFVNFYDFWDWRYSGESAVCCISARFPSSLVFIFIFCYHPLFNSVFTCFLFLFLKDQVPGLRLNNCYCFLFCFVRERGFTRMLVLDARPLFFFVCVWDKRNPDLQIKTSEKKVPVHSKIWANRPSRIPPPKKKKIFFEPRGAKINPPIQDSVKRGMLIAMLSVF